MKEIEEIRDKLYNALNKGNKKEVLALSRRLDKLIVEWLKRLENKQQIDLN